ncbi:hypothetical protein ACFX2I_024538 [Malus domestica]
MNKSDAVLSIRISELWKWTFGNGGLNFGASEDDVMIITAFFLLDEVIVVPIFASAAGIGVPVAAWGKLNLRNVHLLDQGEGDADHRAQRNQNLGPEI